MILRKAVKPYHENRKDSYELLIQLLFIQSIFIENLYYTNHLINVSHRDKTIKTMRSDFFILRNKTLMKICCHLPTKFLKMLNY
jgi:hypothetical protein